LCDAVPVDPLLGQHFGHVYSKVSSWSPKEKKARPRWEETEREGDVVDDDDDDDEVDDEGDAVGRERGKKESKGKEERRKKTKKTPNDSAHSPSPSLHPHNYLFCSTSSISSIPLDLP
jgi:hypothetical protein